MTIKPKGVIKASIDGNTFVTIPQYSVQPYNDASVKERLDNIESNETLNAKIKQTTGLSMKDIMSQKAVTELIEQGYKYFGIAKPNTRIVAPTVDAFWFANQVGDYIGGGEPDVTLPMAEEGLAVITHNVSGVWEIKQIVTENGYFIPQYKNDLSFIGEMFYVDIPELEFLSIRKANDYIAVYSEEKIGGKYFPFAEAIRINKSGIYPIKVYAYENEKYPIGTILGYIQITDMEKFNSIQDVKYSKCCRIRKVSNKYNSPIIQQYINGLFLKEKLDKNFLAQEDELFMFNNSHPNPVLDYSESIKELYVVPNNGLERFIGLWGYKNRKLYLNLGNGAYAYTPEVVNQNMKVYQMIVYEVGSSSYKDGDIAGYVVPSDVDKLFSETSSGAAGNVNTIHCTNVLNFPLIYDSISDINGVKTRLENVEEVSKQNSIKVVSENKVTWELENDTTFFNEKGYKALGVGQYTKRMTEPVAFNAVRVNKIFSSNKESSCQYEIYLADDKFPRASRDNPTGIIPENYTLLKKGVVDVSEKGDTFNIDLDKTYTCDVGHQVVIYFKTQDSSEVGFFGKDNGYGNPEETSNTAIFSLDEKPISESKWYAGAIEIDQNLGFFATALNLMLVPTFVTKKELSKEIGESVDEKLKIEIPKYISSDLKLTIPDKVYAVVGTELNLWNDTITLSIDKGIMSPINYQTKWVCEKGYIHNRGYRFIPGPEDIGNYECTCSIYDLRGELIESKTFSIIVLAKDALSAPKNIVYFGDSLGASAATELFNNFQSMDKFTGTKPTMLGTIGSSNKYEAVGGYTWSSYATAGTESFRLPELTGVASLEKGAVYKADNNNTFEIAEVNITEGSGNILLQKKYVEGYGWGELPMPSGTLTKLSGSGESTIDYTGAFKEASNPLWNVEENRLDVSQYKSLIGLQPSDKIDAASFQFGINDANLGNNLPALRQFIKDLYDAFIADNPNFKMIIGLTTTSGNDVDGSGANYGADDYLTFTPYAENVYKIRKYLISLQNDAEMPNIRIAPISLGIDRYYGYELGERNISQRYPEKEKYHVNFVHPGASGYGQLADMYFAEYIGILTE